MNSHELAKYLLSQPDGPIQCSVDISTDEDDSDSRVFGEFVEVGYTPSNDGFGNIEVMLLFVGCLNDMQERG